MIMLHILKCGCRVIVRDDAKTKAIAKDNNDIVRIDAGPKGGKIYPPYAGPYDIIPLAFIDQQLPTEGRVLKQDILVQEVPYLETSNDSGGITVSIAS